MDFPAALNGWTVYGHPCFMDAFNQLVASVEQLQTRLPETYQSKPETKLLAVVLKTISGITGAPSAPQYRQGKTLGDRNKNWSRAKFGNGRFRLFFRYSTAQKVIVLAWLNDENTLRTYGSKHDAYAVFKKMLAQGNPPGDWRQLSDECGK